MKFDTTNPFWVALLFVAMAIACLAAAVMIDSKDYKQRATAIAELRRIADAVEKGGAK